MTDSVKIRQASPSRQRAPRLPYGEPQPSAAPRPHNKSDNQRKKSDRLEDLDGYILDGWEDW